MRTNDVPAKKILTTPHFPTKVVIEGERVKIFATIPLPNKIHEREMDKSDLPGTFNAGATLGPVNETNMKRIWNKHKINTPPKPKVFVGLSGGVDSAVSAKLLMDAGHEVTGVFIRIWQPEFLECTWEEDRLSAKRVAAALGIRFLEVDLSAEYKRRVVDDMIHAYECGETPNPDVLCNEYVKFGSFLAWALEHGADKIATGHYARIAKYAGTWALFRGIDATKDQAYFLHRISGVDLERILFPIGGYTKKEVRTLARKYDLPNARRKDSQGLCFVGAVDIGEFLSRFRPSRAGDVLNGEGEVIGRHEGYMRYTLGERHGFTVMANQSKTPQYIISINPAQNTVIVSPDPRDAMRKRFVLREVHWISESPAIGRVYDAEVRYHQKPQRARLVDAATIQFDDAQLAASGQSIVLYEGDRCLGGGIVV